MSNITNKFLSIMMGEGNKSNDLTNKESISDDMTQALVHPVNAFDKTIQAVNDGKEGYTSLDLMDRKQTLNGINYPMGDVIIKAKPNGSDKSELLFVKENESLDATIYAGCDDNSKQAFISTQDPDGKENIIELEEFHSLSMSADDISEFGILTTFNSKFGLNTGLIEGQPNLNPVKQLLLSDSFAITDNKHLMLTSGDDSE